MEFASWRRQPQRIAAAVCVAVGLSIIALGPLLRVISTSTPASAEPLADPFTTELLEVPTPLLIEPTVPPSPPDLIVYVSGAVAQPDVYRLPAGARVKDAVVAAGGLLAEAASAAVNLAAPVSDAEHIHIPQVDELAPPTPLDLATGVPNPNHTAPAAMAHGLLDLNRATQADLEELPGIGKVLAERIVAYRNEHGAFSSVADLRSVTGIGAKLFAQLEPLVVVQ